MNQQNDEALAGLVSHAADALGQQLELHVELVKAEVTREVATVKASAVKEVQAYIRTFAPLALGLPLLAVGHVFLCVAVALALEPWVGAWGGAAIVAALNLLFAAVAIRLTVSRLRLLGSLGSGATPDLGKSNNSAITNIRSTPPQLESSHVS